MSSVLFNIDENLKQSISATTIGIIAGMREHHTFISKA